MRRGLKLAVTIMLLCILSGVGNSTVYAEESAKAEDFYYEEYEGEIYIEEYVGTDTDIVIPEEIEGKRVVYVALNGGTYMGEEEEVQKNTTVKSISIPSGVKSLIIYNYAGLENIYISEENEIFSAKDGMILSKDGKILYGCIRFQDPVCNIPEGVERIYISTFQAHEFKCTTLNLPASYQAGYYMNYETDEYEDYVYNWFGNFPLLETINVAEENKLYSSKDGVLYDKEQKILKSWPPAKKENPVIEQTVTEIGESAFDGAANLTEIVIPEHVTDVRKRAFENCPKLERVVLPQNLTVLETACFMEDEALKEVELPAELVTIGNSCFLGCVSLASVQLPSKIEKIEADAFFGTAITEIVIPASVTTLSPEISDKKFQSFDVEEGNAVYAAENNVLFSKDKTILYKCMGAVNGEFRIPEGVTTIKKKAFASQEELKKVVVPASVVNIEDGVFEKCFFLKQVELPEGLTQIPDRMFGMCSSLTDIKIPSAVTRIGSESFDGCQALTEIVIPESVTDIDFWAFSSCSALKKIIIPKNVTRLGRGIFAYSGIDEIHIESTKIESLQGAFNEIHAEIYVYTEELKTMIEQSLWEDGEVTVRVVAGAPPVELSCAKLTLYTGKAKNSAVLKAILHDTAGTVKWTTSDKSVATVKNGKITALKKGKAVITAKVGANSASAEVTVKNPAITIVDGSEVVKSVQVKKGKTVYYRVHLNPAKSGLSVSIGKSSKKTAKVTVKNGSLCIKGLKKGTVQIQLKSGKTVKKVKITVK